MLRIIIELWPGGWADNKKTIAVMDLYNDGTGTPERGNYKFMIYRKPNVGHPSKNRPARKGEVKNYPRMSYPVWQLIRRALNTAYRKKDATDCK